MTIKVPLHYLTELAPKLIPDYYKGRNRDGWDPMVDLVNAHTLDSKLIRTFKDRADADVKVKKYAGCTNVQEMLRKVIRFQSQPDATNRMVSDLDDLLPTLKEAIHSESPERHWLYREMGDGAICPAYVADIKKVPYRRDEPAHVDITLIWVERSKKRDMTVSFFRSDISRLLSDDAQIGYGQQSDETSDADAEEGDIEGDEKPKKQKRKVSRKLNEILQSKRLYLETKELFEQYRAVLPIYGQFSNKSGLVMLARGDGFFAHEVEDRYDRDTKHTMSVSSLEVDDSPANVVLDDTNPEKVAFGNSYDFWSFGRSKDESDFEIQKFWDKTTYSLPFHPYILCFDLRKHSHVYVHCSNLVKRDFDKEILTKLVLPETDKKFLSLLMNSAGVKMTDIITGKAGGIFILSEGNPGVGKTLTAEIYAEQMERALYTVQCSQLGVDPEEIEKRLKKVLERAQRWGAVLLLDEADVYVRARSTDIRHNAIVGVMLRVIEYYNGLLFMTTNLSNIDDAIKSRATAHVVYKAPTKELLFRIWQVLSSQFEVKLSDDDIAKLVKKWPQAVGRDVKNLIKLTKLATITGKEKGGAETVEMVARYLDMEAKEAPSQK